MSDKVIPVSAALTIADRACEDLLNKLDAANVPPHILLMAAIRTQHALMRAVLLLAPPSAIDKLTTDFKASAVSSISHAHDELYSVIPQEMVYPRKATKAYAGMLRLYSLAHWSAGVGIRSGKHASEESIFVLVDNMVRGLLNKLDAVGCSLHVLTSVVIRVQYVMIRTAVLASPLDMLDTAYAAILANIRSTSSSSTIERFGLPPTETIQ